MSHQTGIEANDALRKFFGKCKTEGLRLVKVSIENEELTLCDHKEPIGSWEDDYDVLVLPSLDDDLPCYILYRLDSTNETGSCEWLFICWSPDDSPVRQKMLYASTKATLKKEFGSSHIAGEVFGTVKEDVSLAGYRKHERSALSPAPMTMAEEELQMIKKSESGVDIGVDTKHQTIQGIAFPMSDDVIAKLFDIKEGLINYMQMSIDLEKEEINLESSQDTNIQVLPRRIPKDHARYHLFRFNHSYDGDYQESIVFIYSMPGHDCPIRERMMYSSCMSALVATIELKVEMEIAKKIQIDDGKELTLEFLTDELHPKTNIHRQKFAKPKGPPNRGAKRITKVKKEEASSQEGVFV